MINDFDSGILQAIDLGEVAPNSNFSIYIMLVTASTVKLYTKFNGIWLD
jgi:hypothetical protein